MTRILATLLALVFWMGTSTVSAQSIRVQASVSATEIGTEEAVTFTVSVSGSDGSGLSAPPAPETRGLSLLQSTPGTQRNVSIVNGQVSQSFGFTWSFRPIAEGSARIEPVTITVNGTQYTTEPIDIRVVAQSQRPARAPARRDPFSLLRPPANAEPPPAPTDRDIFIRATPRSATIWRNEQLVVEYKLYFREGIQLRQSRLTDSWDAEGFWREELDVETRPIPQTVVENGLRYNVITLKRAAVFPARAGDLTIDPLRIESEAMLPFGQRDPFQSLFSTRSRYTPVDLASPEVSVTARPLPDNAPETFQGAVGRFNMDVRVDKTTLEVGSSLQVQATISGTGNLATMAAPVLDAPAVFDVYDPQTSNTLDRSGTRLAGSRTFSWVLIPRSNGTFDLPPVRFSWFDPGAGVYRETESEPFSVTVTGTSTIPDAVATTTNGLPVDDVAPVITSSSTWASIGSTPLHHRPLTYILMLLPLLIWGGVAGWTEYMERMAANPDLARGKRAHPLSRKHLKQASLLLDDTDTAAFFEELDRAVLGFIGNRLNVAERGMTRERLASTLATSGATPDMMRQLNAFLDVCDLGRYAPANMDRADKERALDTASTLIPDLDEVLAP